MKNSSWKKVLHFNEFKFFESEHNSFKYMIIDFDVSCNCYEANILSFFGFWKYSCPACGAKNSLTRHAKYDRYICYLESNEFICIRMTILRLICGSCETTHAILPAGTIPYCYFTISVVFKLFTEFLIEENSIPKISEKFSIVDVTVRYYWYKYLVNLASCTLFLRAYLLISTAESPDPPRVFKIITANFSPDEFLKQFFHHTKQIFLMTRRRSNVSYTIHIGI
jgi:ribosomal protein S27AE